MIRTPEPSEPRTSDKRDRHTGRANFNNPAVVVQSWYVAGRSESLPRGQVRSFDLGNRRVAIYRDMAGALHALDARCPHLGADLGHGRVVGNQVECAFHGWRFGPDGNCSLAPGLADVPQRRVRAYPTEERWGLAWIFNGPRPLFALPDVPPGERLWRLRPPPQQISCHPHIVIANGLDVPHFEALHNMRPSAPPRLRVQEPYWLTLELRGKPRSRRLQYVTGSRDADIVAEFTTIGSNLAWLTVREPVRFHMLFSGRPTPGGGCHTQTVLFVPVRSPVRMFQAVTVIYVILRDDRRILDHLAFSPSFTENDVGLRTFARIVDAMETW